MTRNDTLFKTIIFFICLLPLVLLITDFFLQKLGANPVETIIRDTGLWSLRFLIMTLCITPLRKLASWQWGMKIRRMLGLYAFFYGCLHLIAYLWFDHLFDLTAVWRDILERPFITLGFITFLCMLPLAITSTNSMMRRLGKRWQQLHRLIYLIAITSIIHFWWMADSKGKLTTPIIYATIVAVLLLMRIFFLKKSFSGKRP